MKKAVFIVNPVSGVGRQKVIERLVDRYLDETLFDTEIRYTDKPGHATEISRKYAESHDIVVAVGGDGSVNEVARGLIGSRAAMGIIPSGSGNGFARSLKIPMNLRKAMEVFNDHRIAPIDTIRLNDEVFINMAGIGFDAHIARLFANYGRRGFVSYLRIILREFVRYPGIRYTLRIAGKEYVRDAFLTSFANSTQYGNNGHIAPLAEMDDGLIDICIVKKFPLIAAPVLAVKLLGKKTHKSRYMEIIKAASFEIYCENDVCIHYDGEPAGCGTSLKVRIDPLSLKVVVPFV
ncbi:MAG: diacylglycerol kinase family lipid kinase [Bacteroidetes bacterium]|nr:diacylglycerol kinase family lipid kinase [Bacteroidota bacterium]